MICHQTSSSVSNYFDMIDGSRSIHNSQLKNGSSICKSKSECNLTKTNDSYFCLICNRRFIQKSTYQNHLRIHEKHETAIHSCNICNKSFAVPARLARHYRTHTGEKPYQCEYCEKSFSVKENLSVHRRIHTKERPYRCDVCQSGFEHSGKLHRHMRIHTGERPHKCSICDKTFIQSGQLVIHMRTHTGEKPYICKLCGKGFTCSKQLKVHTRTHTGEKPYGCDICGKSFGYNHVLKLHQVAHYGEKFYKCILCQKSFNSKKLMEIHIKSPSNCKAYDVEDLNSITTQTIDIINEIIPYNSSHPKFMIADTSSKKQNEYKQFREKSISCKVSNSNKKMEQLIYHESYQNVPKNVIKTSKQNLSSEIIIPGQTEDSQSFSLLCRHPATNLNKFDACAYKMKEYTFITPTISSKNHSSYLNLEETILLRPPKTENLSGDENLTSCYENITQMYSMNSSLHVTDLDIVTQNSRKDLTLPSRKRCKINLESFLPEKSPMETPERCSSVIKFAKTDKTI